MALVRVVCSAYSPSPVEIFLRTEGPHFGEWVGGGIPAWRPFRWWGFFRKRPGWRPSLIFEDQHFWRAASSPAQKAAAQIPKYPQILWLLPILNSVFCSLSLIFELLARALENLRMFDFCTFWASEPSTNRSKHNG